MSPAEKRHLDASRHLMLMCHELARQADRVESFLTFAPPADRDLAAIAAAIKKAHDELQVELAVYVLQHVSAGAR